MAKAIRTFQVYKARPNVNGQAWRWRCRAPNGRIVYNGGEGFFSKTDAEKAARRESALVPGSVVVVAE